MSQAVNSARAAFLAKLEEADSIYGSAGALLEFALPALGWFIMGTSLGRFAGQLQEIRDGIAGRSCGCAEDNILKADLLVPDCGLPWFSRFYGVTAHAIRLGAGTKDAKLLETYRLPLAIDVSRLSDPVRTLSAVDALVIAMYQESAEHLGKSIERTFMARRSAQLRRQKGGARDKEDEGIGNERIVFGDEDE